MSRRRNKQKENQSEEISREENNDELDGFQPLHPESGFSEEQFYHIQPAFPFKTAFCVMTFLILGVTCLVCSALIIFGYVDSVFGDRAGPLFICGMLLFIPGAYFTGLMLRTCLNPDGQLMADVLPKF